MSNQRQIQVKVKKLPHALETLPSYRTEGSVGMDLFAAIGEPYVMRPLERVLVPTGLCMAIEPGYEGQIRARSGISIRHGITVCNGIGTVDWDYRDEVKVGLINVSRTDYTLMPGDRIAQIVFAPITRAEWVEVQTLEQEASRSGGFGSTGR